MSKIEMLRLLINQRLTEAAEEIFGVFGRTIAEYEDEISRSRLEIDRQRRLLDLSRKPQISVEFTGTDLSEQQDWTSSLDLDEMKPPHIKDEEVDQEYEGEAVERDDGKFLLFQNTVEGDEDDNDHMTSNLSCQDAEDCETDPQQGTSVPQSSSDLDDEDTSAEASGADPPGNGQLDCFEVEQPLAGALDSYICSICGQAFPQRGLWAKHVQVHRKTESKGDKSFTCDICGKRLTRFDGYQKHLRIHTGEKPYGCLQCGRRFSDNSNYKRHIRTHMVQKRQQS
ncbi:zinc finger and SCAN domain-containing protein 12-like [Labrus mixtus]|uniref:zinc finger and SCAN domain-containing protein 12-like n=1 Tax=Labrus mixtus TaxID=508554 RepID=UPI0029C04292|nr:zinc finger and SCAN domain-containing protein 12-like [Labrus mixtus]